MLMIDPTLASLGLDAVNSGVCHTSWIDRPGGGDLPSINPATGEALARVMLGSVGDYNEAVEAAGRAFFYWRSWPAPRRGEVVRQIGEELRKHKSALGRLVSLEVGKIRSEGEGEVQEMIDMCDFAVGLSDSSTG